MTTRRTRYAGTAGALRLGQPFGEVLPPHALDTDLLAIDDARTAALRILALYYSELTFFRVGDDGAPPVAFKIPLDSIHIEAPNNDEDVLLPCIVFTQDQEERFESPGFVSELDENTRDKFGPGTVLQVVHDHVEEFQVEGWSNNKPERRALIAGLQEAMVPTEGTYGVRFRIPDYFNVAVMFTAMSARRPDEQAVRGRRLSNMRVQMQLNVVKLVRYVPLTPLVTVNPVGTTDPAYTTIVWDEED